MVIESTLNLQTLTEQQQEELLDELVHHAPGSSSALKVLAHNTRKNIDRYENGIYSGTDLLAQLHQDVYHTYATIFPVRPR